jgi:aspartate aminotransferase
LSSSAIAKRITTIAQGVSGLLDVVNDSRYLAARSDPTICDFVFGNPHEAPIEEFSEALRRWTVPQNKDWFAYKMSEPEATSVVARTLRKIRGLPFEDEHICMTNGAFAGLAASITALVDPGEEVIFVTPPWFFYEGIVISAGANPVRVRCMEGSFDLDLKAIEAAITENTRAIIVNSPNNPTGKVYSPSTLEGLGDILRSASARFGRPVYLISDEAYSRIVFDRLPYPSPVGFYEYSLLIYTYGKTLLTPGERLGYIGICPSMPASSEVAQALFLAQAVIGWAFPNSVLQHALEDIEDLSIDIAGLQRKRDRMVEGLRAAGYEVHSPEGAFYLLPKSPVEDDKAFAEMLAESGVFVLPASIVELPGYFRLSLTASEEMVERALPLFAEAIARVRAVEALPT